jgi:glycosyltransferase involved in cell wall biosynthesis
MTAVPPATTSSDTVELTILMPCLNEAETLATCIRKARSYLADSGVEGEVLIADNGSDDGSQAIAAAEGARVVDVPVRGYGAALIAGIEAARGEFVIMGDADDSYDFAALGPFVDELRAGADLVMGNRFAGGIEPGAMPNSHRYLGNPVLSGIGRLFFRTPIGDFHCGLRGFRRDRMMELGLTTTGMEFASEMVVKSALAGFDVREVPTTLSKDGRSRPPHLNTWRDGWRHLRFLLVYSPSWLYLYPGLFLALFGILGVVILFAGEAQVGEVTIGVHTFVAACMALLIGLQAVTFSIVARRYAVLRGLLPPSQSRTLAAVTPDRLVAAAMALFVLGVLGGLWTVWQWAGLGFGDIEDERILRVLTLSFTAVAASLQLGFTAFLAGLMELPVRGEDRLAD